MKASIKFSGFIALSLLAYACGDGTSFVETEAGRVAIDVKKGGAGESDDPSKTYSVPDAAEGEDSPSLDVVGKDVSDMDDGEDYAEGVDPDDGEGKGKGKGKDDGQAGSDPVVKNEDLAKACAKSFAGKAKAIRVISSEENLSNLSINEETVIAARLSGNQSKLTLDIAGVDKIAGICIFATGNQPQITINSAVNIGRLVYAAAGNQSKGVISLSQQAELEESVIVLKGNKHELEIKGVPASHCSAATIKGNGSVCR